MKKPLTTEELRRVELETLKVFRDYCNAHGLRYYLSCGTLLGAVRHQGFIPWDDDIDVYMPRPDYDALLAHFEEEPQRRYRLMSRRNKVEYYPSAAKLIDTTTVLLAKGGTYPLGVFIDIFPMDFYPKRFRDRLRCYRYWALNRAYLSYDETDFSDYGYGRIKAAVVKTYRFAAKCRYRSKEQMRQKVFALWEQFSALPPGDAYTLLYHCFWYIPRLPAAWFEPAERLPFEGEMFAVPKGYRQYLAAAYGKDYMCLPPEEQRHSHHDFECYWAEEEHDKGTDRRRI